MIVASNSYRWGTLPMSTLNKVVLVGLLLCGLTLAVAYFFGYRAQGIFLVAYFVAYALAVYSLTACALAGTMYLVRRKRGFLKTLYPVNAGITVAAFLIVLLV